MTLNEISPHLSSTGCSFADTFYLYGAEYFLKGIGVFILAAFIREKCGEKDEEIKKQWLDFGNSHGCVSVRNEEKRQVVNAQWKPEVLPELVKLLKSEYGSESSCSRQLSIPEISGEKKLYLSGKMPHWLLASLCLSYANAEKYVWQAGLYFVCVQAASPDGIGKTVSAPEEIDIKSYFKNRKQAK